MTQALYKVAGAVGACALLFGAGLASAQVSGQPATASAAAAATQAALGGTGSALSVAFTAAQTVPAGGAQVALAILTFQAPAGQNIAIQSIPVVARYSTTLPLFTSCSIQNVVALGTPLSSLSAGGTLGQNGAVFTFPTPILIPAGTAAHYALVCSVSPISAGARVLLGINPGSIMAVGGNGSPVPVVGVGSTGPLVATVTVTPVGSSTPPGTPGTGGGPGIPNTGAGGDAVATLAILALSLIAAYAGAVAVRRAGLKVGQ